MLHGEIKLVFGGFPAPQNAAHIIEPTDEDDVVMRVRVAASRLAGIC
jgi:hypothetical protein